MSWKTRKKGTLKQIGKRFKVREGYFRPKYYRKPLSLVDPEQAMKDAERLKWAFKYGYTRERKKRIKMVLVSAANKAQASGNVEVAEIYRKAYSSMNIESVKRGLMKKNRDLVIPLPKPRGNRIEDQIGITILRKPRGMSDSQWKWYLRRWGPTYYRVPLTKFNPLLVKKLRREFGKSFDDITVKTLHPNMYKMYLQRQKMLGRPTRFEGAFSHREIFLKPSRFKQINRVDEEKDYRDLRVIVHECLHSIGGGRKDLPTWLDEGSIDIATADFIFRNYPISSKARKELDSFDMTVYWGHVAHTTDLALLVSKGDKQKALKFVNELCAHETGRKSFVASKLRDTEISREDIGYMLSTDKPSTRKMYRIMEEAYKESELKRPTQFELLEYIKSRRKA